MKAGSRYASSCSMMVATARMSRIGDSFNVALGRRENRKNEERKEQKDLEIREKYISSSPCPCQGHMQ